MAKVVHFEIPVDDMERAATFYSEALGWSINRQGFPGYWLAQAGPEAEPGADGALISRGEIHRSPVVIVGVESVDEALVRVRGAGGEVVQGREPVPGIGWAAYVRDPEGNVIGLFQPDAAAG